jgi:hypothetical protein
MLAMEEVIVWKSYKIEIAIVMIVQLLKRL